jgi:hypothetical protein
MAEVKVPDREVREMLETLDNFRKSAPSYLPPGFDERSKYTPNT